MPPPEIPVVKVDELVESNHLLVQTEDDSDKIYDKVEELPAFPGGEIALMRFLSDNMKYPKVARESGIQGRVVVQFVVGSDGSIGNAKVIRSINPYLDKEALRVVSVMPRWKPGMQKGKPVSVQYTMPLMFRLE